MNERLKELRKVLNLTLEEFGNRLGVTKMTISRLERGDTLTDQMFKAICREFNVNEEWLRYGTGTMFPPVDRNAAIAKFTKQLLSEESDSFKNRFITVLSNLTIDEWKFLEKKAQELCGINDNDSEDTNNE